MLNSTQPRPAAAAVPPPAQPQPQSPGTYIGLLLLLVASLTVIANAAVSPSIPGLRDAFRDTAHVNTLAGLVITLPSLGIVLTAGIGGWLCDRFGRRPVMMAALVLYGVAGVSSFFASALWQVLIGRMLLGIGIGGTMTAAMAMIGDMFFGEARIRFMSTQPVVMSGMGVLMTLAGGMLGEYGWRYPFLVYLIAPALLPLVYFHLGETLNSAAATTRAQTFSLRPFLLIGITALLSMIMYYLLPTRVPFRLRELGVTSTGIAGIAVSIGAATMAATAAFYGRYGRRLSAMAVYTMIFGVTAIGFWFIAKAPSVGWVIFGSAVTGVGYGWLFPVNNIMLMERSTPENRGRAAGFHTTSIFFGQFLSPLLTGPVADRVGDARTFMIFAGISAAIAAIFYALEIFRRAD